MADKYKVSMQNTVTGAGNPAIVDFSVQSGTSIARSQVAAQILAYLGALGAAGVFGASTSVFGIDYIASGASGGVPLTFPVTEYAAQHAANAATTPAWTAYSTAMGSGSLEAIGIAVTVSLYTGIPGRASTGRHYLPYIGEALNDGNGRLVSTAPAQIEGAYLAFLLGIDSAGYVGGDSVNPVVFSATRGSTPITTPKVSRNFARLKTRTR